MAPRQCFCIMVAADPKIITRCCSRTFSKVSFINTFVLPATHSFSGAEIKFVLRMVELRICSFVMVMETMKLT